MSLFRVLASAFCTSVLLACSQLPDLDRARIAVKSGHADSGVTELQKLSQMGFFEAKLALADHYVNTGQWDRVDEIISLYEDVKQHDNRALSRLGKVFRDIHRNTGDVLSFDTAADYFESGYQSGDVDSLRMLVELYLANPEKINDDVSLRQWIELEEQKSLKIAPIHIAQLHALTIENASSRREIKRICVDFQHESVTCTEALGQVYLYEEDEDSFGSLLKSVKKSYKKGLIQAKEVFYLANTLSRSSNIQSSELGFLYSTVAKDYDPAFLKWVKLRITSNGNHLKRREVQRLDQLAGSGNCDAGYLLGRVFLDGIGVVPDSQKAFHYLQAGSLHCKESDFLLGIMYRDGWLGQPDFASALEHLLSAARAGMQNANRELAEMYWLQKGVRRNPAYAYSFALLSSSQAGSSGAQLQQEIEETINAKQKAEAMKLYVVELDRQQGKNDIELPKLKAQVSQYDE